MEDNDGLEEVKELNQEVRELKKKLNILNDEKEAFFKEKEKFGAQIRTLIGAIKQEKIRRNKLTDSVKDTKEERTIYNKQIQQKIAELKKVHGDKPTPGKPYERRENPAALQQQKDKLEYQLETEVMGFEKEKKLMKHIKDLKKRIDAAKKVSGDAGKASGLSKELDELRKKADAKHHLIQTSAKKSQEHHESILSTAASIDELKKKEDEFTKKFQEKKSEFGKVNSLLKEKLSRLGALNAKLGIVVRKPRQHREETRRVKLAEKRREAEEKLRKRQKLTTEDLLALQSG